MNWGILICHTRISVRSYHCQQKVNSLFIQKWPEMFYKKAVLKHFAVYTENHQCWSQFLRKWLRHISFPANIMKFLRITVLENVCERLLLFIASKNNKWCHFVVRISSSGLFLLCVLCVLFILFSCYFSYFLWSLQLGEVKR